MVDKLSGMRALSELAKRAGNGARAEEIAKTTGAITKEIPIADIVIRKQVRTKFESDAEFAARVKQVGHVHTAILVKQLADGKYLLMAGERRVRASKRNSWEMITATIFPEDTTDFSIRMYQVSENMDRLPLSLRETAYAVAEDVERFGREQATKLWINPKTNESRSAAWVSKHLRFQRFGLITRALFDEGMFDDVEAAGKMDDIEAIDPVEAQAIAVRIRDGDTVGRVWLDTRLTELRAQHKGQQSAELQKSTEAAGPVQDGGATQSTGRTALRPQAASDEATGAPSGQQVWKSESRLDAMTGLGEKSAVASDGTAAGGGGSVCCRAQRNCKQYRCCATVGLDYEMAVSHARQYGARE